MNILCGPNGIGKTTILECCAHTFAAGATPVLKSWVGTPDDPSPPGKVRALLVDGSQQKTVSLVVKESDPLKDSDPYGDHENSAFLLSLKTGRVFSYQSVDAVRKDNEKSVSQLWDAVKNGVSSADIKNWFINRDMYLGKPKALSAEQVANFELASQCFSILNSEFRFSHVGASTFDIYVSTPTGTIVHEYLSSGFKSCLVMLLGIIKELELRFPHKKVEEIEAIVLIDEIELHLHPDWQGRIAEVLMSVFPKIQFIVTTHSPHVIQSAERNQIVALQSDGENVVQRPLPDSPYGYKGWTVDEVLTDVMGMSDTRSDFFNALQKEFNDALDARDKDRAKAAYAEIEKSLHPSSVESKLMRLQVSGTDWDSK